VGRAAGIEQVLLVSPWEKELLVTRFGFPPHKLQLAPFLYDTTELPASRTFAERRNFVFIGNFRHDPNADWCAAVWAWPLCVRTATGAAWNTSAKWRGRASVSSCQAPSCTSTALIRRRAVAAAAAAAVR
jgi:hypothetical protein